MGIDIPEIVRNAGVVGAGGAGFPTHIKISAKVDTYIANGAECEPLLYVDQQLMKNFPDKVVNGLKLGMDATGAERGIIAIKKKYTDSIKALKQIIEGDNRLEIFLLEDFYPSGDEYVLVHEILQRSVPEGGIPLDIGVIVNNIGTLINLADAFKGKPVISRYVTIGGAVREPQTAEFPIGTPILTAIDVVGGSIVEPFKVIIGGPIMGKVTTDLTTPITKTTSGITVLPENHFLISMKDQMMTHKVVISKAACIKCELCTIVCPRYLLGHALYPDRIMRIISFGGEIKSSDLTGSFLCCACGACTYYGCPMGLDPCKIVCEVQDQLIKEGMKNPHKRKELETHPERKYRKLPSKRIVSRLDLIDYDVKSPIKLHPTLRVDRVRIPLRQHIGLPAIPIVRIGDQVKKGDIIGKIPEGSLGAVVHASISGTVKKVQDEIIIENENRKERK
ncbi:MAG: 4Fe-4S dicluster domain-containing protein [Candidatus Hodarchaeales archaeon]|jgi:RnfABCDGE-type electron transport complex C subunit